MRLRRALAAVQVARKEAAGLVMLGKQAIDDDSNQVRRGCTAVLVASPGS